MQYNIRVKALLMGVFTLITGASAQQFTNVLNSGWWRTNPTTPNIGRGVAIGPLQGLLRNEGTLHIDEFSASSDLNDQSLILKC